jgi:hypothetical protein
LERPPFTLAFLAREARLYQWEEVQAINAARELVIGLNDLHRVGVKTNDLHLGSIGIDGIGRVRVSPWALGYPHASSKSGDVELVASVLESGARTNASLISRAGAMAIELHRTIDYGDALTCEQILEFLADQVGRVELPLGA